MKILYILRIHYIFRLFVQRKKVSILLFHECDIEVFRKSIIYFKKHYSIISLNDYINNKINRKFKKPYLILTFDDGCASNYQLLETIINYKIPVTIYIINNYMESNIPFWWNIKTFRSSYVNYLKTVSNKKRLSIIDNELSSTSDLNNQDHLSIKEITEMLPFVDFQSHTLSHPILTKCSKNTIEKEIVLSKKLLNTILKKDIVHFAYPNGNYNSNIINILKDANYKSAVTVNHGFNDIKPISNFELNRILIGDGTEYYIVITSASGAYASIKKMFMGIFK
jgi:poly-beta-1,6-N-acetyl-D-glucosamine N-deacetylase